LLTHSQAVLENWEQGAAGWRHAARVAVLTAYANEEPDSYGINIAWADGGTADPVPRPDTTTLLVFVGTEPGLDDSDGPEVAFERLANDVAEVFPALRLTASVAERVDEFESGEASFALEDAGGADIIR